MRGLLNGRLVDEAGQRSLKKFVVQTKFALLPSKLSELVYMASFAVIFGALLFGPGCWAQVSPRITIAGSAVDSATGHPIAEAAVSVTEVIVKSGIVQHPDANSVPAATVRTGIDGTFQIAVSRSGRYRVGIRMNDYVDFSRVVEMRADDTSVSVDARLQRHSILIGRVFDGQLRKPVAGMEVTPFRVVHDRGRRALQYAPPATTDVRGNFRLSGLRPGSYLLEVHPPVRAAIRILSDGEVLENNEPRKKMYRRFFYPEGGLTSAPLVTLLPGAELNLGDVPATAEQLFQIHAKLLPGTCSGSDTVNIALFEDIGTMKRSGPGATKLACDSRFVVTNVAPGTYRLRAWVPGRTPKDRPSAFSEIIVRESDMDVDLALETPMTVHGRLQFHNGSSASPRDLPNDLLQSLRFSIQVTGGPNLSDEFSPTSPSAHGAFIVPVPPAPEFKITVAGVHPPRYVKQILYNGSPLAEAIFRPNRQAIAQNLAIVLDDDSAIIRGTTEYATGRAIADASVVLLPWPLRHEDGFPVFRLTAADTSGRFEFQGMAPGKYRVLSFPPWEQEEIQMPNVLATRAQDAMELDVKPYESKTALVRSSR